MIKLAHHANKVGRLYKERRDKKHEVNQQEVLANKIIHLWKVKKAPVQGKKYRGAVLKLRNFIKSKTSQWKNAQKTRAVDMMVLFLQEHKRANLPIVVANFIHGVKVLQRWCRNYAEATHNRVKAMMMMWEDIETEWFAEEEVRLERAARSEMTRS